jgi:hypothetical protein
MRNYWPLPSMTRDRIIPLGDDAIKQITSIAATEIGNVCDMSWCFQLSEYARLNDISNVFAESELARKYARLPVIKYKQIELDDTSISVHLFDVDNIYTQENMKKDILTVGYQVSTASRPFQNKIILCTTAKITSFFAWITAAVLFDFIQNLDPDKAPPTDDEVNADVSRLMGTIIRVEGSTGTFDPMFKASDVKKPNIIPQPVPQPVPDPVIVQAKALPRDIDFPLVVSYGEIGKNIASGKTANSSTIVQFVDYQNRNNEQETLK